MVYDFLDTFHKRMEIIAIVEFIISKISRKPQFKECGFDEEESINLILLVLCFIMEKSLIEESCTKDDIASYIRTLDAEYFKKEIPDEEYMSLTDYIIKDCLQNGGIPYYFSSYNYREEKPIKINVKIIDDKRVIIDGNKTFSYYLTPQGYKFMFNTLEIEESMQISIEQLKLSISIRKRNFGSARQSVDNLFNICRSQIQKINYFIKKVKEDIGTAGIDEYEEIYNNTFASLEEQKQGYESLYRVILTSEEELINDDRLKYSPDFAEDIDNIVYIKNRLRYIISEQSKLLLKQQELQKIYSEAIDNILYIGFENRLDFEETFLNRIEESPNSINAISKILRPLFRPAFSGIYNINLAYKEQRIESYDEAAVDGSILCDDNYINKGESEREKEIKELNEKYTNILDILFKEVFDAKGHRISLGSIVDSVKKRGKDEYIRFIPEARILLNVLLQLHNMKNIEVGKILESQNNTVFTPSEEFDIKYCVLQLLTRPRSNIYKSIINIYIEADGDSRLTISEMYPDDKSNDFSMVEQLVCPEMVFKAEVKEID